MSVTQDCHPSLVQRLATLLQNYGDSVLDGSSTVTLQVTYIQHLAHLFEQYILCTNQHSFLALPSHPADTIMLLKVQFLFDMLQKTISLKELLLLCGGDFSTALPWLELHTLNFSYNNISCLDESLRLLHVLKSMDLSHNKIQECSEFLKPLCELKHLNLAYNTLQRAPELGLNTKAILVTLVLRHNQLESINGVEHLSSLQSLDLAYNLLMEHRQLAPLAFLHNLNLNMKVRTASISESSNTELSLSPLQDIILWHQKDIEKLDSFREQVGEDWLRYQHHLYGMTDLVFGPTLNEQLIVENNCTPLPILTKSDCTMPKFETLLAPLLLKKEEQGIMEFHTETESTLQWTNHSFLDKATLDRSLQDPQHLKKADTDPAFKEEEDLGVELCRPMLVRVFSEMKDSDTRKALEPLFLRVHQAYILEVDTHQGCVKSRFELDSLRGVSSSHATWKKKGKESFHSVLELRFSYISRERQRRNYLMLDDDPQEALQVLLELLSKIAVENEHRAKKKNAEIVWLHCLRCQAEYQDRTNEKHTSGDAVFCPECNSDNVIQLARQVFVSTSMPVLCGQNNDRFDYINHQKGKYLHGPILVENFSEVSIPPEGTTDTFRTEQCGLFNSVYNLNENCPNCLISSSDSLVLTDQKESKFYLAENWSGSFFNHESFQDIQGYGHAVETVDHRLKLFLDVELFETEEEIRCFQKMSVVKFGYPEEVASFVVLSSQRIYILEMNSHLKGLSSEYLQKKDSHQLCDLRYLEVGLGSQSIHMEFDVVAAPAYTLLIRDGARCKHFFHQMTTLAKESAPKSDSKIKIILNTQLSPKHHLWPLVSENSWTGNEEDSSSQFFYLLAFLQLGDSLTSVSVLATKETLFLLNEDHQWIKSCFRLQTNTTSSRVTVYERQPISYVSSIHLYSSQPCQVDIQFYDELTKEERTWLLKTESVKGTRSLVNWIKDHWEFMFGVKLITAFYL
ncbi:Serine/threonine-protein kinase 11-interacting protein [Bagarius yarrelli]|uniref:Serine/threonine-protein kinase 11-interacting protein n=1 Tax=Bagarius yarrelli TaxID=175774 RepID=A0A556TTC5_BAGYA|nr:Serine/threonine-protein kinase 11-interacting protein [Bagarius yarrelli]